MQSGSSHKRSRSSRDDREEPDSKRSRREEDEKDRRHSSRGRSKPRSRSRSRSKSRGRRHSRDRSSGRGHEHRHDHEREKDRKHERNRSRDRSRERSREQSRDRGRGGKEGKRHEEVDVPDLPRGWRAYKSSSGDIFYYNSETKTRQWNKPGTPSSSSSDSRQKDRSSSESSAMKREKKEERDEPAWNINKELTECVRLLINEEEVEPKAAASEEPAGMPSKNPLLVMPKNMYSGIDLSEDESRALSSIGIVINVDDSVQDDGLASKTTRLLKCACAKCSRDTLDPRVARTARLLSCGKGSTASPSFDEFVSRSPLLDCFF